MLSTTAELVSLLEEKLMFMAFQGGNLTSILIELPSHIYDVAQAQVEHRVAEWLWAVPLRLRTWSARP